MAATVLEELASLKFWWESELRPVRGKGRYLCFFVEGSRLRPVHDSFTLERVGRGKADLASLIHAQRRLCRTNSLLSER